MTFKLIVWVLAVAGILCAQRDIYGSRVIYGDLTVNGPVFFPSRGTTLPVTCTTGQVFFRTQTQIGLHQCTSTDVWVLVSAGTHAVSHQHGGGDEVAVATPAANAIPKAGGGGALAAGWVQEVLGLADLNDVVTKRGNSTSVQMAGAGTPATDDCAKFDANGNLVSAGAACGDGGGTSITRTAVAHSATPTYTRSSAIQQWTQTLTSNVTSSTLSGGASAGDLLSFELTQDGTGSRTWAGPTGFPTLTLCATANSRTTVQYFWTGSAAVMRSYSTSGCAAPAFQTDAGSIINVPDANGDFVTTAAAIPLDLAGKVSTKPSKTGTSPPGTCTVGETFIDTDATATSQWLVCTATNTWTAQGGVGGGGGGAIEWTIPLAVRAGATTVSQGNYGGTGSGMTYQGDPTGDGGAAFASIDLYETATSGYSVFTTVPTAWNGTSGLTVRPTRSEVSGNSIVWQVRIKCFPSALPGQGISMTAWTATATNTLVSAAAVTSTALLASPISLAGCTAGNGLLVNVARLGADVGDTNFNPVSNYAITLSVN